MKPGPKRAVSEEAVLDAAFDELDGRQGAVSVRGVAARLGLAPGAVYTYFPSKAALTRGMVERMLGEADLAALADSSRPWRDRLLELAEAMRGRLGASFGTVSLVMSAPLDGPHALALGEGLLSVFARAGLEVPDAARAAYAFQVQVIGFIALEAADRDAARRGDEAGAGEAPDHAEFPLTADTADVIAGYNTTGQFVWGLARLLDGLVPCEAESAG